MMGAEMVARTQTGPQLPDFKTAEQRTEWIKGHADYYVATVRVGGISHRSEHATLEQAQAAAHYITGLCGKAVMIYACVGPYDSWVATVHPQALRLQR